MAAWLSTILGIRVDAMNFPLLMNFIQTDFIILSMLNTISKTKYGKGLGFLFFRIFQLRKAHKKPENSPNENGLMRETPQKEYLIEG